MATVEELEARIGTLNAELTNARSRITELNEENKTHRLAAKDAQKAAETAAADLERVRTEHATALAAEQQKATEAVAAATQAKTDAEKVVTESKAAADTRIISAELRAQAAKAGMVDLDGLKIIDTSAVKLDDKGEVVIPEKFFEEAKTAKPYLFGASQSTSSTHKTPAPGDNKPPSVADMSDADFEKAVKARAWAK